MDETLDRKAFNYRMISSKRIASAPHLVIRRAPSAPGAEGTSRSAALFKT
jgi:hypothetical protein